MYTISESAAQVTLTWGGTGFIFPASTEDTELLMVSVLIDKTTAGAAGGNTLYDHNTGGGTGSGALTIDKVNTRSPAAPQTAFHDVSVAPTTGPYWFMPGGGSRKDNNIRWRPPRPWARPKLDTLATQSGNIACDRNAAGQVANETCTYTEIFGPAPRAANLMRLYRRPRRAGMWHYYQGQNGYLAQDAMPRAIPPEYWVSETMYAPSIRQDSDSPLSLLSGGAAINDLGTATVAGTSAISASLSVTRGLAATIAGVGTVLPSLSVSRKIAATVTGSSTVTAQLADRRTIAAAVAGSSTISAALSVKRTLQATVAGSSVVTAALSIVKLLAATVAGTSTVSGAIIVSRRMSAAIVGSSVVSAALSVARRLSATVVGTSIVTVATVIRRLLTSVVSGSSVVSGDLTIQGAPPPPPPTTSPALDRRRRYQRWRRRIDV